jgi:hypothetical protein
MKIKTSVKTVAPGVKVKSGVKAGVVPDAPERK